MHTGGKWKEFARFLVAGGVNTILTYLLYEALRRLIPYLAAYSIAYLIGIALSYFLNSTFVFRRRVSVAAAVRFPLVYVAQYLLGAALLWLLVGIAHVHPSLGVIVVIMGTIPVTFVLSRIIIAASPARAGAADRNAQRTGGARPTRPGQ